MRRLLLTIIAAIALTGLFAQQTATINGVWERGKPASVKLFSIVNGSLNEIASSGIGEEGSFTLTFAPAQEGAYYALGLSASSPLNRYLFYFKPGDRLSLRITANSYELIGGNTPENQAMAQRHQLLLPLEEKSVYYANKQSTYLDFFPLLEEKLAADPPVATPNAVFNRSFEDYKQLDLLFLAINFIQTPRSAHPQQTSDYPAYYKTIDLPRLSENSALLHYPNGASLWLNAYMTSIRLNDSLTAQQKADIYQSPLPQLLATPDPGILTNRLLRGELVLLFARLNKTQAGLDDYGQRYRSYLATPDQQQRWEGIEAALSRNAAASAAIDFRFPDPTGKEIALSDFKGKVVYIDVWATWCGPCKKEFPAMKQLEADYHDNSDIVFIGINVDTSRNKNLWLDFLAQEHLPGLQIFAGDRANQELMQPYRITGIPRFILVSKSGHLILADAPRPSSEEIRSIINAALQEKQ
jgi:thiol-disulfide isomerase/thioredoxin